jgi:xylulokinase
MRYLLGLDIGSSSVKASLLDIHTGRAVASAFSPEREMLMESPQAGFAEQHPDSWWDELVMAMRKLKASVSFSGDEVAAIGISYQMHGLVVVDDAGRPLRSSIIWCDGRAVSIGNKAFIEMGERFCLDHYLNSPGNFTASKLKWVKDHEPGIYAKIHKMMLPGDYIAYRLTGEIATTISGLSEGILWDYRRQGIALDLLVHYGISEDIIPDLVPQFGEQGRITATAAAALGLVPGIPVTYRAGDQPNNALSLNVLKPGEVAATAGTSGVVYGVTDRSDHDPHSRVNAFVHVNHRPADPRYGVLLCINGTGILNSWLRRNDFAGKDYEEMNRLASEVPIGAEGLMLYPFGNGAERVLENLDPGAWMQNLHFNRHDGRHMARAAQEGIVFALRYGMEVMQSMGMQLSRVRAGHANMFLSPLFREAFANVTGCVLELYNTDGAQGAARAAGVGAGVYATFTEAFSGMDIKAVCEPGQEKTAQYRDAYARWRHGLKEKIDRRMTGL